jgi:2-(1,2-epoxy-1,2-dihydrophenyl)acetyl-CoA isomerase
MIETIRLEYVNESHARLVLARPERRNAMGIAELKALAEATHKLVQRPPRVLSIVADGANFGVGGDIQAFGKALNDGTMEAWLRDAIGHFNSAIRGLRALDAAIVVGIQGAVAGGALGLVWAADHVIVADNLALNLAYARLGGSPDGGTSWFLPRLLNPLRAFELFTLTPTLDAKKALDWGLANQVVQVSHLNAAIDAVVAAWLSVPPKTLGNFKRLLRASADNTLSEHLQDEMEAFVLAGRQPEFAEKVAAFLWK